MESQILSALLPAGLAFLMFSVGMKLTLADFRGVFGSPKALLTGLAVQMLFLPLAAILLALLFGLSPLMATGLVILSVSPGGITSNYIAMLARADVALSAAMTMITSLAAAISVPAALSLASAALVMQPPSRSGLGGIALAMTLVSVLPLVGGMALARLAPGLSGRFGGVLDGLSKAVFAAIVISTFVENWGVMTQYAGEAGLACILLNLAAIGMAFAASAAMKLSSAQAVAVSVEAGMQNAAISMFVAASLFGDPALAIPALIYALAMNFSAMALIAWRNSRLSSLGRSA